MKLLEGNIGIIPGTSDLAVESVIIPKAQEQKEID